MNTIGFLIVNGKHAVPYHMIKSVTIENNIATVTLDDDYQDKVATVYRETVAAEMTVKDYLANLVVC